jgi:hypothetical protein
MAMQKKNPEYSDPSPDELLKKSEVLIEQINTLLNQYLQGAQKTPPTELRIQLESILTKLSKEKTNKVSFKFKYQTIHARYLTYRERWDKITRDLESGKIQIKKI